MLHRGTTRDDAVRQPDMTDRAGPPWRGRPPSLAGACQVSGENLRKVELPPTTLTGFRGLCGKSRLAGRVAAGSPFAPR
jgi:hypothetical protein